MNRFEEVVEFLKVIEDEIKNLKDIIQKLSKENEELKKKMTP